MKYFIKKIMHKVLGTKNIIIFKGHGDFDGNAYALYKYMVNCGLESKYKFVWSVSDYEYWKKNKPKKCIIVPTGRGLKRHIINNCAKYVFFDCECPVRDSDNVERIIYLSHGCPPLKNASKYIAHPLRYTTDALVTSEETRDVLARIRNLDPEKMFVCGQPRNDIIFNEKKKYSDILGNNFKRIILWMPTFRKYYKEQSDGESRVDSNNTYLYGLPLIHEAECLERINQELFSENSLLIIKPHPHAAQQGINELDYSNIKVWTNEYLVSAGINLYSLFNDTDAMISDYSSVSFDFMLTDHPLAYITDDMDEYKLGFAYDNILDYMPGKKIISLDDFCEFIKEIANDVDEYKIQRSKVNLWANTYQDGKNCERIVKLFDL